MNKELYFEYVEEFADYIIGRVEDDEELFIAAVGKFDSVKPLLKEVMTYDFVDFENIGIESEAVDGYTDEFVLSLWMDDDVLNVGCEKLKRDDNYILPCGDETYLMEDCSSKVIPLCEDSDLYFVNFGEECDCYEECGEYCPCCDDRKIANVGKSPYTINGKPVTKTEFDKKYKELMGTFGNWFDPLW